MGYDVLLRNDIQIGVTMDADNQQMPEEIERLVEPILNNEFDLVIGSRVLGTTYNNTMLRSMGVNFFTKIVNLATGLKLTDCSSVFKVRRVPRLSQLPHREAEL